MPRGLPREERDFYGDNISDADATRKEIGFLEKLVRLFVGDDDKRVVGVLAGVRAVFFLVSPDEDAGQHLRLLGHLATRVDDPAFLDRWTEARTPSTVLA